MGRQFCHLRAPAELLRPLIVVLTGEMISPSQ
jgi:hypothetical protein